MARAAGSRQQAAGSRQQAAVPRVVALVLLALGAAGCAQEWEVGAIDDTQGVSSSIVGGTRDDDEVPRYPQVGFLVSYGTDDYADYESYCSATMLTCGAILTAAHRVWSTDFRSSHGALYRDPMVDESLSRSTEAWTSPVFIPEYVPLAETNPSAAGQARDLAVLVVDPRNWTKQEIAQRRFAQNAGESSVRFAESGSLTAGTSATLVGFGWGLKRSDGVCDYESDETRVSGNSFLHSWHRRWTGVNVTGTADAGQLLGRIEYHTDVDGALPAQGDSGGPLFLSDGALAGVQSTTIGSECASHGAFGPNLTDPSVAGWLADTLARLDRDGDGAPDACDLCPDTPDDGTDSDGDYVSDACDGCPCDPTESDPSSVADSDGDGICGQWLTNLEADVEGRCVELAKGQQVDRCPNVFNDPQENCNAEAERARGADELPDACDPVPCPRFTPTYDGEVSNQTVIPIGNQGVVGKLIRWDQSLKTLQLEPIGSHPVPAFDPDDPNDDTEVAVEVATTEYRACVDVPGVVVCERDFLIDDALLRDSPASTAARPASCSWWAA